MGKLGSLRHTPRGVGQTCPNTGRCPSCPGSALTAPARGDEPPSRSRWSGLPSAPPLQPAATLSRPRPHGSKHRSDLRWLLRQAHTSSRSRALLQEQDPGPPHSRAGLKALSPRSHDIHEELTGVPHGLLEGLAAARQLWRDSGQLPDRWPPRWPTHHRVGLCQGVQRGEPWGSS